MIIKANRHGNGAKLASYLMNGGTRGERVEEPRLIGFADDQIHDAFRDIEILAEGTKAENPFFHVQIRLPDQDHLSRDQWHETADRIQRRLGLEGQPRADVFHMDEKSGEIHLHLVFSLIDAENLKAKPLPFFKLRMKTLARELEEEFDLTRVANKREGPILFGATKNEQQQAQRLDVNKDAIRNAIRNCWDRSDCGYAFENALAAEGLILARGDRRDYVVLDHAGGLHALGKRILGVPAKDVKARLADLEKDSVPGIDQVREFLLDLPQDRIEKLSRDLADVQKQIEAERQYAERDPVKEQMAWEDALAKAAIEKEQKHEGQKESRRQAAGKQEKEQPVLEQVPAPELGRTQAEIRLARVLSPGPQSFANALEDRGMMLAAITPADIQKDRDRLLNEWEERRKNPQTWMEHEGGFKSLNPELQESARRSFDEWNQQQAGNDKKTKTGFKLEDYVDFVQRKWQEAPKSQLERATGNLAVVTRHSSVYVLTPRNTGLSREELPDYLKGISVTPLLSVTDAKAVIEDVQQQRQKEWLYRREEWQTQLPVGRVAGEIRLAYSLTNTGPEFANALEDRGLILAEMTEGDTERLNRWERQRLKEMRAADKEITPDQKLDEFEQYHAGELVVIDGYSNVFQLTASTTGAHEEQRETRLNEIDRDELLSVRSAQAVMAKLKQQHRQEWLLDRREEWQSRQPISRIAGEIRLAYSLTNNGQEFASALEDKGLILAEMNDTDAERLNRWERQRIREEGAVGKEETTNKNGHKENDKYRSGELVVVDEWGHVFQLTAATTGARSADRGARLDEIDREKLLSVSAAQSVANQIRQQRRQEKEEAWQEKRNEARIERNEKFWPVLPPQPEQTWTSPALHFGDAAREAGGSTEPQRLPDLSGNPEKIREAWQSSDSAKAFVQALEEQDIVLALISKTEADRSHRQAAFAKEIGGYTPRYHDGELVAIAAPSLTYTTDGKLAEPRIYRLDEYTTGGSRESVAKLMKGIDRSALHGLDQTRELVKTRTEGRIAEVQVFRDMLHDACQKERLERAQNPGSSSGRSFGVRNIAGVAGNFGNTLANASAKAVKGASLAVDAAVKPLDFVADIFDGFLAPKLTPAQKLEGEIARRERDLDTQDHVDQGRAQTERVIDQQRQQQEAVRERERERDR